MPETENDTIAAIATAMAPAGIGIIRISGDRAVPIGESLFRDIRGEGRLTDHPAGSLRHGHFVDAYGMILDEGMAVYFVAPRSYSGEDMVELQCHGGLLVLQRVLEAVLAAGARLAKPGEFSRRAFLNGRMDLTQAEAVMDLIGAENDLALSAARKQLGGLLGARIRSLREKLIHESAFIEAALDDPESFDGALEGYPERLKTLTGEVRSDIKMLLDTADQGILSRNGIRTAIIGRPNVGKSSILNLLTGTERAIVSDISGTTRDTIEESVRLGALSLHLTDTAGLADGSDHPVDAIESIGIARAKASMEEAQLILFIFDITKGVDDEMGALLKKVRSQHSIVIANKTDLCTGPEEREQFSRQVHFFSENEPVVFLSAKTGEGLPNLKEETERMFLSEKPADAAVPVIASTRHKMLLQEAESGLISLEETIGKGLTEDFYVVDLMRAYRALGEIIGEEVGDDLVEEIFSKFCMGK